ncbi:hypothetical protein BAZ12_15625 [Elizabethkingia miricola]|uniref:hypothetical protein n=1 Tax=Elizabethkingia miricola TaxID=172045 RepID=UPI00099B1C44|nr:hypothetical protein [Elizabethkingia miricola]OPC67976.1 hypothetical protein BAZ12_15625 [Elizabethkingia miricola]
MKKVLIIIGFVGFALAKSQVVVSDPGVQMALEKSIAISNSELTKTISILDKQTGQLELLGKMKDKVDKVNSVVGDMQEIRDIVTMQKESIATAVRIKSRLSDFKTNEFKKVALNDISNSLSTLSRTLQFVQKVLTSNFFSMSDKERMDIIRDQKTQAFRAYMIIRKYAQ